MVKVHFFTIHGWQMWAAWSVISILQIASARYLKHKWHFNMWLHRLGAFFILAATLLYGVYAIIRLGKIENDLHAPLGLIATGLVSLIVLSGLVTRYSL